MVTRFSWADGMLGPCLWPAPGAVLSLIHLLIPLKGRVKTLVLHQVALGLRHRVAYDQLVIVKDTHMVILDPQGELFAHQLLNITQECGMETKEDRQMDPEQNDPQYYGIKRRGLIKALAAGGGAAMLSTMLPGSWLKPVIRVGVLPAHAQTSGGTTPYNDPGEYTLAIPASASSVTIIAKGGSGGAGGEGGSGGQGGTSQATFSGLAGQILYITVGGLGESTTSISGASGGTGGGGGGGDGYISGEYGGGGGGGGSYVSTGAQYPGGGALYVAAGGGGGGSAYSNVDGGLGGGNEITAGVADGADGEYNTTEGYAGKGGRSSGGAAGSNANAGSAGNGGNGATGHRGGGGGGGGYFGGGGGGSTTSDGDTGGGGGGSSFVNYSGTSVTMTQGGNTGNGSVTITWS